MHGSLSQNPVLLLHGMSDSQAMFILLTDFLVQHGHQVHAIDLIPSNGSSGLELLGQQVAEYASQAFAPDQPFDLVGFSMGGIVARYYVQRLGGLATVQRLITIAAPHFGTSVAYVYPHLGGAQMRPNSKFLTDLNQDLAQLESLNLTSIWTPLDLTIFPASASTLPVGKNVPLWILTHTWMVTDPRAMQAIADALAEPIRGMN